MNADIMHLFLLERCTNLCPMCCNKLYNIDEIPVATVEELKTVKTVCLTGGEPFLVTNVNILAVKLKKQFPNIKNVYVYTSGNAFRFALHTGKTRLKGIDGITICPKCENDWVSVSLLCNKDEGLFKLPSNRLYTFVEDPITQEQRHLIDTLKNNGFRHIERYWNPEFKTPENEIFRRLPILLD